MVGITDTAAQALQQALEGQGSPPEEAFRLSPGTDGQIALSQSRKEEGDVQLNSGDRPVVFVEASVAAELDNHTLDVEPAGEGMRLMVRANE